MSSPSDSKFDEETESGMLHSSLPTFHHSSSGQNVYSEVTRGRQKDLSSDQQYSTKSKRFRARRRRSSVLEIHCDPQCLPVNSSYLRPSTSPAPFDVAFGAFYHEDGIPLDVQSPEYPETFLRSVFPIPCHSHNDEARHTPLHAALGSGCISIEADIFASEESNSSELYVAHVSGDVRPDRTLRSMYIEPLMSILEMMNTPQVNERKDISIATESSMPSQKNGVYALSPTTSLTLLLDFKSPSAQILPLLKTVLEPLIRQDYLTRWDPASQARVDRPITVVASGATEWKDILHAGDDDLTQDPLMVERYIFFDAPLDDLVQPGDPDSSFRKLDDAGQGLKEGKNPADGLYRYMYNPSNSHLASASFARSIGAVSLGLTNVDSSQRRAIRAQLRAAHDRGLTSRYWSTPRWPTGLRDGVWEVLQKEGIGLLNVDDLRGVRKGSWGRKGGGRWWGIVSQGSSATRSEQMRMGWLPED